MKIKFKYTLLAIILLVVAIFVIGYVSGHRKAKSASEAQISTLNKVISSYVVMIGDNKTYISKIEQENKTQKEAIRDGDIERKELRALNLKQVNEINRLKVRVDTLLEDVSNSGGIITIHDTITLKPTNYIKLPFVVTKNDQWLSLKDSTDIKGKTSVSLKMNLSLDVYTGIDKTTKKPTTIISTDSPYIGIIGIKSQKYDLPKPKKYGVGVFVGYGVGKDVGLTPIVGIGIGYTPINF